MQNRPTKTLYQARLQKIGQGIKEGRREKNHAANGSQDNNRGSQASHQENIEPCCC